MTTLSGTTASREIAYPTKEKIEKVKLEFLQKGYEYVGEANTGMHIEESNSYMRSTPSITLYFQYL